MSLGYLEVPRYFSLTRLMTGASGYWASAAVAYLQTLTLPNLDIEEFYTLASDPPPLDGSGAVLLFLRKDQVVSYQNLLRHPLMSVVGLLVAWYLFNPLLRPVLRAALHLLYL
jgi:hypothetical protein